jgi:hypothetical protein
VDRNAVDNDGLGVLAADWRLLCLLLALYAFAIFGYVTAAIAAKDYQHGQRAVHIGER